MSEPLNAADCADVQDVAQYLGSHGDSFCRGVGEWLDYYYQNGRISKWDFLASLLHDIPPYNGSGNDLIVIHQDIFDSQNFNDLITSLTHEILHSEDWNIGHDTSPSNWDLDGYCTIGGGGGPPPPPLPPPGD